MTRRGAVIALGLAAACSGGHGGGASLGDGGDAVSSGDAGPPIQPIATCDVPAAGAHVDTSAATNVVGTGTPDSCTETALQA
jgi:hypothetical protein